MGKPKSKKYVCEECKEAEDTQPGLSGDLVCKNCAQKMIARADASTPKDIAKEDWSSGKLQIVLDKLKGQVQDEKDMPPINLSLQFLCQSMDYFHKKDIQNDIKFKEMTKKLDSLSEDMVKKDKEIAALNSRVKELEQNNKRNNLIVNGIDFQSYAMATNPGNNQNAMDKQVTASNRDIMVEKFSRFAKDKLSLEMKKSDIQQITPIKSKNGSRKSTKIVFTTQEKKREVYAAKKMLYERKVKDVYINEDLNSKNFKLLMEARRKKRENLIESAWSYDCAVFVKTKSTGQQAGQIIAIRTEEDFRKI